MVGVGELFWVGVLVGMYRVAVAVGVGVFVAVDVGTGVFLGDGAGVFVGARTKVSVRAGGVCRIAVAVGVGALVVSGDEAGVLVGVESGEQAMNSVNTRDNATKLTANRVRQ